MKVSRLLMLLVVMIMLVCGEVTCRYFSGHPTGTGEDGRATAARERRQVSIGMSTPIYIDVLVVTDYKLFQQWTGTSNSPDQAKEKITQYYELVMKGVNRIYGTLAQYGMNISVIMSRIHISESSADSSWTEQSLVGSSVNATKALETFKTWVSSTSNYSLYDHVVLFTGHKLISGDGPRPGETITGKAYQNKLCATDSSSLSIVAEIGGFQSVFVAAHELGHSFGALHDGDVPGCSDEQRYLMAVVTQTAPDGSTNPWHFSSCSRTDLSNFVKSILVVDKSKRPCLTTSFGSGMTSSDEAGQAYSPDEMCRQLNGPQSYYCRSTALNQNETICTALVCYNPNDPERCSHYLAPDGTSCGNRMWCRLGVCVSDPQAPEKNPTCIHGDTPYPNANSQCNARVQSEPWNCYSSVFKDNCCASCNARHSGNDACAWGDVQSGCPKQACDRADRFGNIPASLCCQTCGCTGTSCDCLDRHSDCSGVTHPGKCYNETLAFICCQTCNRLRTGRLGCEYGDYYTPAECRRAVSSGSVDSNLAALCCGTCNTTQSASGPVQCNIDPGGVNTFSPSVALLLLSLLLMAVFR